MFMEIRVTLNKLPLFPKKHNIKIIYDAAHAFGSTYKNRYVTEFGDVSMVSFHSTKIIHTIEGAALYTSGKTINERIKKIIIFWYG